MSQSELLLLARQGNVEAIATLMDRKLSGAGIAVEASLDRDCLTLNLISRGPVDRLALMTFVRKGMNILKVEGITLVRVAGWQRGTDAPLWTDTLQLASDGSGMSLTGPPKPGRPLNQPEERPPERPPETAGTVADRPAVPVPPPVPTSPTPPIDRPNLGPPDSPSTATGQATPGQIEPGQASPRSSGTYSIANLPPDLARTDIHASPAAATVPPTPEGLSFDPGAAELPEQQYEAWLHETGQLESLSYRFGLPKLAAYLVYFLTPGEELLDATAVRTRGRQGVLLLTDRRLAALSVPLPPFSYTVVEEFSYPRTAIARLGLARNGLVIAADENQHVLIYDNPDNSAAFINRSLAQVMATSPEPELDQDQHGSPYRWLIYVGAGLVGFYVLFLIVKFLISTVFGLGQH